MIEKILEMLREIGQLKISLHSGRCNGKTLALGYKKGIENAIEIVQEVAKDGGWIPCSERLPEYMEEVLVWHSDQNMHCVAWYNPSTKIWYSNDFYVEDSKYIVAWQPLPALFKKGE